jgi:uncharacterized pyridoxamine 5'-phosphate oxidase family protein
MKKVIDFLKENDECVMATSSNDKPRASIMAYAMVDDTLVFATGRDSIKAKNLESNPRISLSVQKMPQYITIDGIVSVATDKEKEEYNRILLINHPEYKEMFDSGMMASNIYYKVNIETAYFCDMSKGEDVEIIKL